MSTLAVNSISPATGSTVSIPAYVPSAQFSHRNKIINGKMEIAQRGTGFGSVTSGYTLDRWQALEDSDAIITVSQQADLPTSSEFQYSLRLFVNGADSSIATTQYSGLAQLIEGYNIRDLIGKTFTLSFWVRSSKTGIHCVSFRNLGGDRSYIAEYTISAANTWEYKSVTVNGGLISTGTWNWTNDIGLRLFFMCAAGSAWQSTSNAWQTGNFLATANQVNCLDTASNIFAITGVQLEAGAVATPFEHRPYGYELSLCQRYYFRINGSGTVVGSPSLSGTGATYVNISPPTSMRSAGQTLDVSGNFIMQDNTTSVTPGSFTVQNTHPDSFQFSVTHGTLATNSVRRLYINDSTSYFGVSSEL
jgi:hypothetical protein